VDRHAEALLETLDHQRAHVLGILEGLEPDALLRPVLPTGWSCAGLVQHLALDIERFWFRTVVSGELDHLPPNAPSAWALDANTDPFDVLVLYQEEIELANRVIRSVPLETPPASWPGDQFGDWRLPDLQSVLLHVITETACHAGHLDAARELLDGRTWMII
jgi:Protein of unknown function (DUF664)